MRGRVAAFRLGLGLVWRMTHPRLAWEVGGGEWEVVGTGWDTGASP